MSELTLPGQYGGYVSDKSQPSSGGQFSFSKGVWLSRGEGARSDKYHRWTEDKQKTQTRQLDRQKHSSLVKLHGQSLEVRNELRGLQQQRSQSLSPSTAPKDLKKTGSSHSLKASSLGLQVSPSPTPRSHASANSHASLNRGAQAERLPGGPGKEAELSRSRQVRARLNPKVSAQKLKNIHSARALSKLKNDMDISH